MRIRSKFILFVTIIHCILIFLIILLLSYNLYFFIISEIFIVISIILSFHIYRGLVRPLNLIASGIESIKEEEFTSKFIKVGQSEFDQLIDVYNTMIDKLKEERVAQQEQHYILHKLIQASPSGIVVVNFDDKIESLNLSAKSILGLNQENLIGKTFSEIPGKLAMEIAELNEDESKIVHVGGLRIYKLTLSHFIDRGFHRKFILIDELTEEIIKAEKKAYEKVIRMMAHEINNSVGAVNSILDSFINYREQLDINNQKDYEEGLLVAIKRNKLLSNFMSNFAKVASLPSPVKVNQDLNELVRSIGILLNFECKNRNIALKLQLENDPLYVHFDVQQMELVLINIIKNSIEAIEQKGVIIITTQASPLQLSIQDSGKGILEETKFNLFTPFFSTKKDGQGIGLTLIRNILINHGYIFSLERNSKGYTEFLIEFQKK